MNCKTCKTKLEATSIGWLHPKKTTKQKNCTEDDGLFIGEELRGEYNKKYGKPKQTSTELLKIQSGINDALSHTVEDLREETKELKNELEIENEAFFQQTEEITQLEKQLLIQTDIYLSTWDYKINLKWQEVKQWFSKRKKK